MVFWKGAPVDLNGDSKMNLTESRGPGMKILQANGDETQLFDASGTPNGQAQAAMLEGLKRKRRLATGQNWPARSLLLLSPRCPSRVHRKG